jgi:hypothetical protein
MKVLDSKISLAIILPVLGIAGFLLIWFSTPWGIGVGYDSIFYLSASENLLSGSGLSRLDGYGQAIPLTHFPPFYSIAIAGLSMIGGIATDAAARFFAAALFAFLVGFSGWLIFRYTRSTLACLFGAALILISPVLLDVSFMAMSDLLFLVLLLLFLYWLNSFLQDEKIFALIVSAIFAALLYLTRYVGLTAVATGGLAILIFRSQSWTKKFKELVIFCVFSLVPILLWYGRNWYLTGSMTNRVIGFHPPTLEQIKQGISTLSIWLLPAGINSSIRLIGLGLFIAVFIIMVAIDYQKDRTRNNLLDEGEGARRFFWLLIMFAIVYIMMVLLSLTFFDASTKLNDRILAPIYLTGILATLILIWNSAWFAEKSYIRIGISILALLFIGINLLPGYSVASAMRVEGKGFSGRQWKNSETVAALEQLPPGTLMFSNEAFAIYYLTGSPANWIPENYDPVKNEIDNNYSQRIESMRAEVVQYDGALVIFNSIRKHNVYAPIMELSEGLKLLGEFADGVIFTQP